MKSQVFTVIDGNGDFVFGGRSTDVQAFELEPDQVVVLGKFDPARCKFDVSTGSVADLPPVVEFQQIEARVGKKLKIEVPVGTCYDCKGGYPIRRAENKWISLSYPEAGEYSINLACPGRAEQTISVKVTA